METITRDDAVQDMDARDIPAVPCGFVPGIIAAFDVQDHQTVPSLIEPLERKLATASTFEEAKEVRDRAEALRGYLRDIRAGLQEQNRAAATKIRAERVIGDKLGQLEKATGGRPSKKTPDTLSGVSGGPDNDLPTLAELGISHKQSSRWQAVASVPEDVFAQYISEGIDGGMEITTAGFMRFAGRLENKARRTSNTTILGRAANKHTEMDSEEAGIVPDNADLEAEHPSADLKPAKAPNPAGITIGPEATTGSGEGNDLSEPHPPEADQQDAGQDAPQPEECPEDLARPASLAVDPRVDPYRDGAFLWVRGALQALAILAGPVATLREIPNQRAITSALLELLNALAPACLESHIQETDQELALTLLGEYCGYREFAGQLARRWAEADARRNGTQLDMVQWLSDNAGSPKSPETQAETRIPAPNGNAAEANP